MDNFIVVDLEQGTAAWHRWRAGGIGASDAPTIMGDNRWKTAQRLLRDRRSPSTPRSSPVSPAMARGTMLEPQARAAYCKMSGEDVQPLCVEARAQPWMRCSLDGICLDSMRAVEIKCGQAAYKHAARYRSVPDHYYGQLQHTIAVLDVPAMDFFCYLPDRPPILLTIARDQPYIARLIEQETRFWQAVQA